MGISVVLDVGHGYNTAGKRTPKLPKDMKATFDGVCLNALKGTQIREYVPSCGVAHFTELELLKYGFKVLKSGWTSYADAERTLHQLIHLKMLFQDKLRLIHIKLIIVSLLILTLMEMVKHSILRMVMRCYVIV